MPIIQTLLRWLYNAIAWYEQHSECGSTELCFKKG